MLLINFLVVYLPFETFLLKWLPVSERVYILLRQLPDFIVFYLAFLQIIRSLISSKKIVIVGGNADIFLTLSIFWAFITIAINPGSDSITSVLNIKALFRYILLMYILLNLKPSQKQINQLMYCFWFVFITQIFIGIFQLFGGIPVRDFLAARNIEEGLVGFTKIYTGDKFEGVNDLMSTMGDTVSYSYFLLIGMVVWIVKAPSKKLSNWAVICLLLTMIYFSDSKSVLLSAILIICLYSVYLYSWKKVILFSIMVIPLASFIVLLTISDSYVHEIKNDSEHLWAGLMNARLGLFVYVLPKVLLTYENIFGFSPDKYYFAQFVASTFPELPRILLSILPSVLEDVYWLALYIYYGLIGFILWGLFLFSVYKRVSFGSNVLINQHAFIPNVARVLILTALPLNLVNQAFEARYFSFYLWLFCALALVTKRQMAIGSNK